MQLQWTPAMDLALIDSILKSVRNGLRAESGFKKEAWLIALGKVKEALNSSQEITIKQMMSKLQWFKTKWKEWRIMRYDVSGWGWDDVTELFLAEPEQWEAHLAVSFF